MTKPPFKHKIYLASSWRNVFFPETLAYLRGHGHTVYDFRDTKTGGGFSWSFVDESWEDWTTEDYLNGLKHDRAVSAFIHDYTTIQSCDTCVLLLPSGRSAHLEAGMAHGLGKNLIIYIPSGVVIEAELMYAMSDEIVTSLDKLVLFLENEILPKA